jgi:hypothetical protein
VSSPIFGQLETSLADYLTDITYRAQFGDERAVATVARFELPRLVAALKAVLDGRARTLPTLQDQEVRPGARPLPRLPHGSPVPGGDRRGGAGGNDGAHA